MEIIWQNSTALTSFVTLMDADLLLENIEFSKIRDLWIVYSRFAFDIKSHFPVERKWGESQSLELPAIDTLIATDTQHSISFKRNIVLATDV